MLVKYSEIFFFRPRPQYMAVPGHIPKAQLQPTPDTFNPLHQARDWSHASAVAQATAVKFLTHCARVGTPPNVYMLYFHINSLQCIFLFLLRLPLFHVNYLVP